MRIDEINHNQNIKNQQSLLDLSKYAKTIEFERKVSHALMVMETFLKQTSNPVISCGGGKDGTAIALLAKMLGAHVPIICANPPNPLPDRETHNKELCKWLGEAWTDLPYNWDVESVLEGREKYPEGLKMKMLSQYQKENNIDGVIFGIRSAESRSREINLAVRGEIYTVPDGIRCQPIAKWNAQESLCIALLLDAPINPVYLKMDGCGGMEQLHDGTWWPHGLQDRAGWIKKYYPDYYNLYEKALSIGTTYKQTCKY